MVLDRREDPTEIDPPVGHGHVVDVGVGVGLEGGDHLTGGEVELHGLAAVDAVDRVELTDRDDGPVPAVRETSDPTVEGREEVMVELARVAVVRRDVLLIGLHAALRHAVEAATNDDPVADLDDRADVTVTEVRRAATD